MSKQDRQGVRNAVDLERKYNFGAIDKTEKNVKHQSEKLSEVNQSMSQQLTYFRSEFAGMKERININEQNIASANGNIDSLNKNKASNSGWTKNKYIGTDADGNLVEKDKPTASDIEMSNGETVEDKINSVVTLLSVYPVGAIYMSVNPTEPSELFGGTWERFAKGQVLVGVNEEDEDFAESQKVGGKKNNTHSHATNFSFDGSMFFAMSTNANHDTAIEESVDRGAFSPSNNGTGRTRRDSTWNTEISLLQPYITCYMWVRTA